ncbi:MAG: UDP-2,3-diacylglucosamine diphosphatase [Planctomycetota bacterium]
MSLGTAIFISDVHLPPEGEGNPGARTKALVSFLADAAARAEAGACALYILGDLFSYWFEPKGRVPRGFRHACAAIRDATGRGLRVVALPGNRDFLLGGGFARETGAEVARDETFLDLGGKRTLLTHGDSLAVGDRRYQLWRRFSRGRTFRRVARGLPACLAERVAASLRAGSELEKRAKPLATMRYSDRALAARVARGADTIIAGHVHEAGERAIEDGGCSGRVVTLGAWGDSPGARAEWDGRSLRLVW